MNLSNYPLLKILFPYVLGILCGYLANFSLIHGQVCLALSALFLLFSVGCSLLRSFRWQRMLFLTMFVAFFFAGVSTTVFRFSSVPTSQTEALVSQKCSWLVRVVDFPSERDKTVKLVVEPLEKEVRRLPSMHKLLLYVQKSDSTKQIQYGDVLIVYATLSPVTRSGNPHSFDNQTYMRRKGICYTGYAPAYACVRLDRDSPSWVKAFSHTLQKRLADLLATSGMSGQEYDIIKAILLGDDDTMEPDLKTAYASAGVSHILCVSGMHVGIIFMIINTLLKPMDLFKGSRLAKAFILLLSVWLYACITGLSPSVTRSATMFTFVTVGNLLQRNTNVFHSLFASLFILLAINPLLLFEIGFQLSYLAVFGIVLFQPKIVGLYACKTKIGNYFWELISVSLSAQLSTFAISAYYFGQFPSYFLLSNLSVVALSFAVMVSGVVLLVVSFVPFLSKMVCFILTYEIRIMNNIVTFIEQLPGSVVHDIDFSILQVVLLYGFVVLLYMTWHYRRSVYFWSAMLVFTVFSTTFVYRKVELLQQESSTVYAVRKASAMAFCWHQQGVLFSDSITDAADKRYAYSIGNHARRQHAAWTFVPVDTLRYDTPFLCKCGPWIRCASTSYYLLKRKEWVYPMAEKCDVDVLVLQYNPTQLPEQVAQTLQFKKVVADATNTRLYVERWQKWCRENGIIFLQIL